MASLAVGRLPGVDSGWIERRGLIVRTDGEAIIVTRGDVEVMPIPVAIRALDGAGLALWLVGMTWRAPSGMPQLRRLRRLTHGVGEWTTGRSNFLAAWKAQSGHRTLQRR